MARPIISQIEQWTKVYYHHPEWSLEQLDGAVFAGINRSLRSYLASPCPAALVGLVVAVCDALSSLPRADPAAAVVLSVLSPQAHALLCALAASSPACAPLVSHALSLPACEGAARELLAHDLVSGGGALLSELSGRGAIAQALRTMTGSYAPPVVQAAALAELLGACWSAGASGAVKLALYDALVRWRGLCAGVVDAVLQRAAAERADIAVVVADLRDIERREYERVMLPVVAAAAQGASRPVVASGKPVWQTKFFLGVFCDSMSLGSGVEGGQIEEMCSTAPPFLLEAQRASPELRDLPGP
eukprot:m51a1_g7157 hypothetical protein (303) ;mRNA; r:146-4470